MAKNEDGEFELILGNSQLLSVFFLMVLLLALCFVGGYEVGKTTTPLLTASNGTTPAVPAVAHQRKDDTKVVVSREPDPEPAPAVSEPAPDAVPQKTAPQAAPAEPAKVEPPPPPKLTKKEIREAKKEAKKEAKREEKKAEPAPAPKQNAKAGSQPIAGRVYLQLAAIDKDHADVQVDLLRSKNFSAMAAAIPDRPDLYRVLVGPVAETAVEDTRKRLSAAAFPGHKALKKTF